MSQFFEHALLLAAKGCRVFPVIAKVITNKKGEQEITKKPAISRWQQRATTIPDTIRKWWEKWPDANVGAHAIGLAVIDIDGPADHDTLQELKKKYAMPDTITNLSGNPEPYHYHLIYRLPPVTRITNGKLRTRDGFRHLPSNCKIEIKSGGGYFVAPGSVHRTGTPYRFDRDVTNLYEEATDAPSWLVEQFGRPCEYTACPDASEAPAGQRKRKEGPETSYARDMAIDDYLLTVAHKRFPIPTPGQRNELSLQLVGYLFSKGLSPDRVTDVAMKWMNNYQEVYATVPTTAGSEILSIIARTQRALATGEFTLPTDHRAGTAQQVLDEDLAAQLRSIVEQEFGEQESTYRYVLSCSHHMFLRALILHFQYEGREEEFLMTDRQLRDVYRLLTGRELSWKLLYSMKAKYFSRAAAVLPLVEMVTAGVLGEASVYRNLGIGTIPYDVAVAGAWWSDLGESYDSESEPDPVSDFDYDLRCDLNEPWPSDESEDVPSFRGVAKYAQSPVGGILRGVQSIPRPSASRGVSDSGS